MTVDDERAIPERRTRRGFVAVLGQHAAGPAALVAIGYVDPGNWATDLGAGARFAYALLSVVVLSSLAAMLLQTMSAHLGIATGRDLAESTGEAFPRFRLVVWAAAELAAIATDLAEVLGSALALRLLFHIPLAVGVLLTGLDVGLLLGLERGQARLLGAAATALFAVVAAGLSYELLLSRPDPRALFRGLLSGGAVWTDRDALYAAVGILGATVMPHNLYLHSSLVARRPARSGESKSADEALRAARAATRSTALSLTGAMILNATLVVLGAAVFHRAGRAVVDLADAHHLLAPLLGSSVAPVVFAVALLAAGQSASISGTLAGQAIMAGLLHLRWPAWRRRLVTRACTMVPAMIGIWVAGEASTTRLLVASQVLLSLALPFAMVPLILLVSDGRRMGRLRWRGPLLGLAWMTAATVILANTALIAWSVGA